MFVTTTLTLTVPRSNCHVSRPERSTWKHGRGKRIWILDPYPFPQKVSFVKLPSKVSGNIGMDRKTRSEVADRANNVFFACSMKDKYYEAVT